MSGGDLLTPEVWESMYAHAEAAFNALADARDELIRRDIPRVLAEIHADKLWQILGYATFAEACDGILGGWKPAFPIEERREVVADLTGRGMSTRAIASTLGVDPKTVRNDQAAAGGENSPPEEVRGNDGKTYTRTGPTLTDPRYQVSDEVRRQQQAGARELDLEKTVDDVRLCVLGLASQMKSQKLYELAEACDPGDQIRATDLQLAMQTLRLFAAKLGVEL